jgi:RNA polymerase sigma-70 factor (ECF subfamily)
MVPPDQQSFAALLDRHRRILFKVAALYGTNAADRQDLIQEALVQLWQCFDRFDGRSKFSTWMYRVVLNVAISWSRNEFRRRGRTVAIDDAPLWAFATDDVTEQQLANIDLLRAALGRLSELDRGLMLLHLEGHDHQAIADVLGISITNVATKIGRIKQRLQQEFSNH